MRISNNCSICSKEGDEEPASKACGQCNLNFCHYHSKKHAKEFPHHELSIISDQMLSNRQCLYHQIPINIYCQTCEALICPQCGFEKTHKGHNCELIEDVAEKERELLKDKLKLLNEEICEYDESHACKDDLLKKELNEIEKKGEELRREIKSHCNDLKKSIDKREEELFSSVSKICNEHTNLVKLMIGFKEQRLDMNRSFEKIETLGSFELLEAKVTKFVQVQKDFSTLKEKFMGNVEDLHQIELKEMKETCEELSKTICKMGNIEKGYSHNFSVKFSNLGALEREGPTTIGNYYQDQSYLSGRVTLKNGIQEWIVPFSGKFKITAAGASGGINPYNVNIRAGYGAVVSGIFQLGKGTKLSILVGQQGGAANGNSRCGAGGGGGGTFVTMSTTDHQQTPLLVAAGGNGCNWEGWKTNGPGGRVPNPSENNKANTEQAKAQRGGGGGGYFQNGESLNTYYEGGSSFLNGGKGGLFNITINQRYGANGGFGGGGSSQHEGGGGGGYVGGCVVPSIKYTSTYPSYGALSFNSGTDQQAQADANNGNGYVTISYE